ncbi:MAG: L,D-transpeptidase family protein [Thiogranum sp.]
MLSTKRIKYGFSACILALLCALTAPAQGREPALAVSPENAIAGELERTLRSLARVPGEQPVNLVPLLTFYQQRNYRPVWYSAGGISPAAQRWLSLLGRVEQEGMSGLLMHRAEIQQRLDAEGSLELADLDLMLTDSFFQYARKMGRGQLDSSLADPDWHIPQPEVRPAALLEQLVRSGYFDEAVGALLPVHTDYRKLREALLRYLAVQKSGGWPAFQHSGRKLKPGDASEDIPKLRQQLWMVGDLAKDDVLGYDYDAVLERAVIRFQQRHGLQGDGVIGKRTRAALAVPIEERIEQIRLNLERWRWMPRDLGPRYITVNTAAFELQVHDQETVPLSMRVIVGKQTHPTPVFTEKMSYLIVNPYWHVPTKVAIRDLLPKQLSDPGFFQSRSIRVLSGWQPDAVEVDPDQVDWAAYLNGRYFPYKLRQDPGPGNALGRIKFMLPNRFSIYLHDTPGRHLFNRPVRAFSAGCVRVEKPMALANYVLGTEQPSARVLLEALIGQEKKRTIQLAEPIAVYMLYQTAWVDENGTLQFRNDIYGHDRRLAAALRSEIAPEQGEPYAGNLSVKAPQRFLQ